MRAYLEKKYKDILTEYRDGEPGMPTQFVKSMPPFKPNLSKKTVARVVEIREVEKASFLAIAKELRMTQAKAKHTYEMFYHTFSLVVSYVFLYADKAYAHRHIFSQRSCPRHMKFFTTVPLHRVQRQVIRLAIILGEAHASRQTSLHGYVYVSQGEMRD